MDLLRKLAVEQQAAIIAVTHDEKIIGRLDRIFRLRDGRLEDDRDSARAWGVERRASENASRYAHSRPGKTRRDTGQLLLRAGLDRQPSGAPFR
jgi:ABC-type sulfate/molybdate transport systems ATPase subunit